MSKIIIPNETDWTGEGKKSIAGAMEKLLKSNNNVPKPKPPLQTNIPINSLGDYWRLENVLYRNNLCIVDLSKNLLENGASKTQDEWADYYKTAKQKGDFYTGDMPLQHSIFTSLFNQKNNLQSKKDIEEARAFIQKNMRERYLMTLTRIAYQPKGNDKIIHNYNTNDKYELSEVIVGPDRAIITKDEKALTALLGTGDINQIKSVYNWINGTDAWIWRVNSIPKSVDERVARFNAGSGGAYLGCNWDPDYRGTSLGVCIVREAQQKI